MLHNGNPQWLKEAIIYSVDIRMFKDANSDGCGDLEGLISKLDYLHELGITCIWLAPFYPSAERDGGYDVTDYCSIKPILGTMAQFNQLVKCSHQFGIRLMLDLVINHTSNQHPWFVQALQNRSSKYHDYYVWKDQKPSNDKEDVIFPGVEHSNWTKEETTGTYYYHTFYSHEPDLNVANPAVQQEIEQIIRFWANSGIDGFRIDAVPHILRNKGSHAFRGDPFDLLATWKQLLASFGKDKVLVGESDVKPEEFQRFIGNGSKLNALFNFFLNNYLFLSLATQTAQPIKYALQKIEQSADFSHLLNFIRNHDELDLEQLTQTERALVYKAFAPEEDMLIYHRGIRRRLAPMLGGHAHRTIMTMSLLISLPGVPVIRYGDEIGMGDDLSLPERNSVRTIMQWDSGAAAGFSNVPINQLKYRLIANGPYAFRQINVAQQQADPNAIWSHIQIFLKLRKQYITHFIEGKFELMQSENEAMLLHIFAKESRMLLFAHNFSGNSCTQSLKQFNEIKAIHTLMAAPQTEVRHGGASIMLPPYGYCWLLLE